MIARRGSIRGGFLLMGLLALVALWGGNRLYGRYQRAVESRRAEVEAAKDRLAGIRARRRARRGW